MKISRYIPILEWLPRYNKQYFKTDLLAGITVAVMLVPQGMAYGLLAGLPPIYGLYAAVVPLLLYTFFGTSRQLSVGPVAIVSLLVLTGISHFADPGSNTFVRLAIITGLLAGVVQILLGVFKLGFLVNFLSHPVIAGFTSAAAFIIGFSQLKNLLGIEIPRSNKIYEIIISAAGNIQDTNLISLLIGILGIAFILILKKINKAIPGALLAVVLGVFAVYGFHLVDFGVQIVGVVPAGLPKFEIPKASMSEVMDLIPLALTISLISFIESLAIARTLEARHKSYRVNPDQELIALGFAKLGGGFFQSYPTTGSFVRSAINDDAGAKTGVSSIVSALLIAVILLFFTPVFYYVPKAILAAIILTAVLKLIDFEGAKELWRYHRRDFWTMMVTFLITLLVGIQSGVLAGIVFSLALMIYRTSKPHFAILGQLPNTRYYRNIKRYPEALHGDEVLILRFDAQLYFGNAGYFRESIEELIKQRRGKVKLLILDASSILDVDSSGIHLLEEVIDYLHKEGILFYVSGVIGPVRDLFFKTGLAEKIGCDHQFMYIHDAVQGYEQRENKDSAGGNPDALQHNEEKN